MADTLFTVDSIAAERTYSASFVYSSGSGGGQPPNAVYGGTGHDHWFLDSGIVALHRDHSGSIRFYGHDVSNPCYPDSGNCEVTEQHIDTVSGEYSISSGSILLAGRVLTGQIPAKVAAGWTGPDSLHYTTESLMGAPSPYDSVHVSFSPR